MARQTYLILGLALLLFAFQNCGKVSFTSTVKPAFVASDDGQNVDGQQQPPSEQVNNEVPGSGSEPGSGGGNETPGSGGSSDPGQVSNPGGGETDPGHTEGPGETGDPGDVPGSSGGHNHKPPVAHNPGDDDDHDDHESSGGSKDPTELVECVIKKSNAKILLAGSLKAGTSNRSSTRVCVSAHACLGLINGYIESRGGSLTTGPASTSSLHSGASNQCTAVFPGSKGTCKNAQVLSDTEVNGILAEMGK